VYREMYPSFVLHASKNLASYLSIKTNDQEHRIDAERRGGCCLLVWIDRKSIGSDEDQLSEHCLGRFHRVE
jgi:hypothetical protein